ncbi:MAG: hypothetical protein JXQ73_17630 [Phycisphaerae bacterium]|nr:hypothetical protein [Phycisphaerae bacterium]
MQAITIRIPRLKRYVAGDRYGIYGNGGLGEVDCDGGILLADGPFWPGTCRCAGHLNEGHLYWGHLDHVVPDGHVVGAHLEHDHFAPEALLWFTTPLYCLGHYVMAVCVRDAAGNRSLSPPAQVSYTINSGPRPASDFSLLRYEREGDRIVFGFLPSPDLV